MGASLKDIACKLNLSKTTVSWVLSGQGDKKGISAETQSRVLACARSLAYEPNLLARSLNTGVSKTIGLILSLLLDEVIDKSTENRKLPLIERAGQIAENLKKKDL